MSYQPKMIITDLPQEILDEIVENLAQHSRRRANLSACALTCKTFLSPCQRRLFSTVRFLANTSTQQKQVNEFRSIIQRPSCPIGTYVRQLHMYFGGSEQTKTNVDTVFPSILPLLSRVQMLTVNASDSGMDNWDPTLSNRAFTRFLGSPSLTTLVISKFGFPGLLGKCTHVKSLSVWGIKFGLKVSNPDVRPRIDSLSCGLSLATIRYLIPDFCAERVEKVPLLPLVDFSALRRLTLSLEYNYSGNVTCHLINYTADTLEELDCGGVIFQSPKLKPMPCLRTLKRWIHFPMDGSPERTLNELCDVLTHCTTTSKVIQHITINLVVARMGFEGLLHLDWSKVDDIFESPPPMLKELTLGIKYHQDIRTTLKTVREQKMPHLAKMASAGSCGFKFSFIPL